MVRTILAQLYRVGLRSFLEVLRRSQPLLRDLVAAPFADARDQLAADGQRARRGRASRAPSLQARPRRTRRAQPRAPSPGKGGGQSRSRRGSQTSPPASPKLSSDCGDVCSTSISNHATPLVEVVVRDVVVNERDNQAHLDE